MPNRSQLEDAISRAEKSFQECWSKLLDLQGGVDGLRVAQALTTFQPTLGVALYRLESIYISVCKQARELLQGKRGLNQKWLRRRIQTLNGYKHILGRTMDIGKCLGDNFAWLFYRDNYELLAKHYEQEPTPHMPTGIGGRGEIEFIRKMPKFGRHWVLAHSTTTFLRVGDISLIDPDDFSVAAIGELKTKAQADNHLQLTLILIGPKPKRVELPHITAKFPVNGVGQPEPMPKPLLERLNRQVVRMKESFKPWPESKKLPDLGTEATHSVCSKLSELFLSSSARNWGCVKADRGLLLLGIRRRGDALFKRLVSHASAINDQNLSRTGEAAKALVDRSLHHNSLHLGWLVYPASVRYTLQRGMQPVFWWPLERDVIKALLFKEFSVMTIHNPAFLISDLQHSGLEVALGNKGQMRVWKKAGEKTYEVHGMGYFLNLSREHLISDTAIARIIPRFVQAVENANFQNSTSVDFHLKFTYD